MDLSQVPRKKLSPLLGVVSVCLFGTMIFNLGGLMAGSTLTMITDQFSELEPDDSSETLALLQQASFWAPLESSHNYLAGRILHTASQPEKALHAYGEALRLRPLRAIYLQKAAVSAEALNQVDLEGRLLESAMSLDPVDLRRIKPYASWLFRQDRHEEAFALVKGAIEMAPTETRTLIDLMLINKIPSITMREAIPESSLAWLNYANFLLEVKRGSAAERAYRRAVRLVAGEQIPNPSAHSAYYRYLYQSKRYEEALSVILDALKTFPENASFHSTAGSLYERQKISYRAIEHYREALLLNPKLKWVRKRLERLEGKP